MDETGVRNLTFLDKQVSRLRNKKSVLLRSLTNHWAPVNLENTATLYRFLQARWVSALSALCRREILVSHGCPEAWKRNRNTFHRRKHIYDDIYMLIRKYANTLYMYVRPFVYPDHVDFRRSLLCVRAYSRRSWMENLFSILTATRLINVFTQVW